MKSSKMNPFNSRLAICLLVTGLFHLFFQGDLYAATSGTPGGSPRVVPISQYLKEHPSTMRLIGDGHTTSKCMLELTDNATGQKLTGEISTVCASLKTKKPPSAPDSSPPGYRLGETNPKLANIVNAAQRLSKSGAYDDVKLPAEKRDATITQLAIWKETGQKSLNPDDQITQKSIAQDILSKAHIDPASLTPEQDAAVNEIAGVVTDNIDKTRKESKKPPPVEPIPVPVPETPKVKEGECCTDIITIPPCTTFTCDNQEYQDMMTTKPCCICKMAPCP